MSEFWKPIPNYEKYEVSNLGRVKSLHYGKTGKTRGIKHWTDKDGYLRVGLYRDRKQKMFLVHRLVLLAFVGECPDGLQVAHLNGQPDDNRLANLAYVTKSENESHKKLHGTDIYARGEKNGSAKLGEDDVREIRRRLARGETQQTIAREYGVSQAIISLIKTGRSWSWLQ
jgi:hypothetical protein